VIVPNDYIESDVFHHIVAKNNYRDVDEFMDEFIEANNEFMTEQFIDCINDISNLDGVEWTTMSPLFDDCNVTKTCVKDLQWIPCN
jgi:hypothetical protein